MQNPFAGVGRNIVRGDTNNNVDASVYKNFKVTERTSLQFRGELFDIFNHHNFYVLGTTSDVAELTDGVQAKKGGLGSASFLGAAADERRNLQLAVKLTW